MTPFFYSLMGMLAVGGNIVWLGHKKLKWDANRKLERIIQEEREHLKQQGLRKITTRDGRTLIVRRNGFQKHKSECDHTYTKDNVCEMCGFDTTYIPRSFAAECECPWCDTYGVHPFVREYIEHKLKPDGDNLQQIPGRSGWYFEKEPGLLSPAAPKIVREETNRVDRTCISCGKSWWQE